MSKKETKFYVVIFKTPAYFLSKENFNTTSDENVYPEIE